MDFVFFVSEFFRIFLSSYLKHNTMMINDKKWSQDILICNHVRQFFLSFEHLHKNPEQVEAKFVENRPNKELNWYSNKNKFTSSLYHFSFSKKIFLHINMLILAQYRAKTITLLCRLLGHCRGLFQNSLFLALVSKACGHTSFKDTFRIFDA